MKKLWMNILIVLSVCTTLQAQQTVGLFSYDKNRSENGLTLFAPVGSKTTYLIDNCGRLVKSWKSSYQPGLAVYLLSDGTLLRSGNSMNMDFLAGGLGGVVERYSWDGELMWSYALSNKNMCQHHDIHAMPNGNILALVWERKTPAEKRAVGRFDSVSDTVWTESVIELRPIGKDSAEVVWKWQLWDHLVQNVDSLLPNYAQPREHPELLDANYLNEPFAIHDWVHANSLDYDEERDEIMISAHNMNEIWVVDHSTSMSEAASHKGGRRGRGGDFLYRWGNPFCYTGSDPELAVFGGQHDARFVRFGEKKELAVMVYNNIAGKRTELYSSIDVIVPQLNGDGSYAFANGHFKPDQPTWRLTSNPKELLYSQSMSSAQLLSNGNILSCSATTGTMLEFAPDSSIVWKYVNPDIQGIPIHQGQGANSNTVFHCTRYSYDYTGFAGRLLIHGLPIEQDPLPSDCELLSSVHDNSYAITTLNTGLSMNVVSTADCSQLLLRAQQSGRAVLQAYSIDGTFIATIFDGELDDDSRSIEGNFLSQDGVYVLRLRNASSQQQLVVLRQGSVLFPQLTR